jgi:hypothetical protein
MGSYTILGSRTTDLPRKGEGRRERLLCDPSIRRWYNNLLRGSTTTAENRLRTLGFVCETWGKAPEDLLTSAKADREGFEDELSDFIDSLFRKGERADNISNKLKAIKSWLEFNGIRLQRKIKTGTSETPEETVPSHEELARLFRFCPPRERVAAAFMAFAGVRPEVLGNYTGTDGLKLSDLPELKIREGKVEAETLPMKVNVRRSISKGRNNYFTFLSSEGFNYLKEYLEGRLRNGEVLGPDSPVIGHESVRYSNSFLRTTKIGYGIKVCIKAAGFSWRPYILRAYCDTQFDIAESRGLISHPWRQFFMGHKGDIEARYSTNKGRLPPEMVEEMRGAYRKCEPLLSSSAQPMEQMTIVKEAKIETLKSIAKSLFGIDLLEVKVAREREAERELTQDETIELFEREIERRRGQPDPQMMVDEGELDAHLRDGWEYVATLPSGKILIRKQGKSSA